MEATELKVKVETTELRAKAIEDAKALMEHMNKEVEGVKNVLKSKKAELKSAQRAFKALSNGVK